MQSNVVIMYITLYITMVSITNCLCSISIFFCYCDVDTKEAKGNGRKLINDCLGSGKKIQNCQGYVRHWIGA